MSSSSWNLSSEERNRVVDRTGANLFSLAFSADKEIDQQTASDSARHLEKEAYAAAQAQSTTTTGLRPLTETLLAYIRKLAELVVEFVKSFTSTNGVTHSQVRFVTRVVLSTKSFGVEAAQVAAFALLRISDCLKSVNLSDIISGRPESEALEVLELFSASLESAKLTELDLSHNAMGEKGLRACTKLFMSQPSLKKLTLHNIGCSADACLALEELTGVMSLHGLFLYNNMSGDEGGKSIGRILAKMPDIKCFQMASSRVQRDGILNLCEGLSNAKELLELDLNDNPGTIEIVPGLVKLLECQPKLRKLNLSDTGLEDEGIIILANTLAKNNNIEVLELALNEITVQGAIALAKLLPKLKQVRKLDLHENELEDKGAILIAKSLESLEFLEELNFSGNQIHKSGAIAIGNSIKNIKTIKKLELDENMISEDGISSLKQLLADTYGPREVLGSLEANEEDEEEEDDALHKLNLDSSTLEELIESIKALSMDTT
eukprot:g6606.t1